ncbi:tRNA lysidine(34) synthetase TilS, partial [Campylobacter coli]|nr:tRNA lysidine(34) synthetase TilS [Campylobacter coli]
MQIKDEILSFLKKGQNLLAFSYGSDSSALFHFL